MKNNFDHTNQGFLFDITYRFELNTHSDLILYQNNDFITNCGYDYNFVIHGMMWLTYKQISQKNMFLEPEFEKYIKIENDSTEKELFEKCIQIYDKLPLSLEEFNMSMERECFSRFTEGSQRYTHIFTLKEDNRLYLTGIHRNGENIDELLILDIEDYKKISLAHLDFAAKEEMGISKHIPGFVKNLSEYETNI